VATFVLVRIPAIDDLVGTDTIGELAAQERCQRIGRYGLEIRMMAHRDWQYAWFAEVADEIGVGDAAMNRPLDVRMRLGLGQASLQFRAEFRAYRGTRERRSRRRMKVEARPARLLQHRHLVLRQFVRRSLVG